jgi:hypothetical protein
MSAASAANHAAVTWAPPYANAAALRSFMRVAAVTADPDDVAEDTTVYGPAIEAASRVIDTSAGRQFGVVPLAEARDYVPWYSAAGSAWFADIDDLMDDTGLVVTVDGVDVTADVTLYPRNAPAKGRPWTVIGVAGSSVVTVEAVWGWTAVPPTIVDAALLQASRIVKRRDAPFGVAGSPEMGNEIRLLARLDPDVDVLIRAYRRYW